VSVAQNIPDFRAQKGRVYTLVLLLFCLLLTELKNCRRQRQRARWLSGNWRWLRDVWKEATGEDAPETSPSQATLSRLLTQVDLWALTQQYHSARRGKTTQGEEKPAISEYRHYAFDGKSRQGCVSPATGRTEIDVTLLDVETREVVARRTLPDKKGEAPAARDILRRTGRKLRPGVITGDPGFTSPALTAAITSAGHEYLIGLKGNAGDVFELCQGFEWASAAILAETDERGHGRLEKRVLRRIALSRVRKRMFAKYSKCAYLFEIESHRTEGGKTTVEKRYFIGSEGLKGLKGAALLKLLREHWHQENGLHWAKDAVLAEDNLPRMSNRASRVLGFFKDLVVSLGFSIFRSVQRFVDEFDARPREFLRALVRRE
jgi:hypothetical protein